MSLRLDTCELQGSLRKPSLAQKHSHYNVVAQTHTEAAWLQGTVGTFPVSS